MTNMDELYRQVGEALHLGQALELQISVLISIFNKKFGTDINVEGLVLLEDKKTLGRLISELKKHCNIDDTGSNILKEALNKRNYITHHFFNKNVDAFNNEDAYQNILKKLNADTKTIAIATAMTQGFVQGFCEALHIDLKDILIKQGI